LVEVLERKGFCQVGSIGYVRVVQTGKVCININGVNESYFRTYKGLRQALSPILFNQIAEVLGSLLNSAKANGHLRGMVPNLIHGGICHLVC
jgi:hypothetical protein